MDRDSTSWLTVTGIGFTLLTCNSALAVYRSKGDGWSIAFVLSAYVSLLLLFWFLRLHERTAPNAPRRRELKAPIWSLSAFLTIMFSYRVAALMPSLVALLVWAMAAAVIFAGFYTFFVHPD
jgi:Na+/melibiose symporter-like transporter